VAKSKSSTPRERAPTLIVDPVAFWKAQHAQAVRDAKAARTKSPSVLPKLVALEREAWREYKTALAAAEEQAPKGAASAATTAPTEAGPAPGSLEEELAEVRRMRRQAQEGQKLTAAEKLLKREGEIAAAIRQRDEAARKAARKGMTPDELVGALVARLQQMPPAMQERVRRELGW
jgi:hypothetical protein